MSSLTGHDAASCEDRAAVAHDRQGSPARHGRAYWRSLDELADTAEFREFVHREFPATAAELLSSKDRRDFLKVMSASLAFAGLGLGGCRRWPEEKIAPFAHRPAGRMPGVPVQYATTMEMGGVSQGLLVTNFDGRPIKIEGNPQHPLNKGSTDLYAQASILDLYDPDRSQRVLHNGQPSSWADFTTWAAGQFGGGLRGVAILSEATASPSVLQMRKKAEAAGAQWFEYEPLNNDNAVLGSDMAFGAALRPQYRFDRARVIVALDSDFLHGDPSAIKWTRDFAAGRKADDRRTMSRLYAFESTVSLTGANADHRIALRSADVAIVAAKIASAVAPSAAVGELAITTVNASIDAASLDGMLRHIIDDLNAHRGHSLVIAGDRQPAEVHMLAHLMNAALGNIGPEGTVGFTPTSATAHAASIKALADAVQGNSINTIIILGGNPVYDAPADLAFGEVLKKVSNSVRLGFYSDETSALCTWHINRAHFLEAWGDGAAYDGTVSVCQPMIEPLFEGKSAIELLAAICQDELHAGYDLVRRTFGQRSGGSLDEAAWRRALHDGVVPDTAAKLESPPQVAGQNMAERLGALGQRWKAPAGEELEIVFTADMGLYDGRFANNGWLQELPDPIAKLVWDNALWMNPATAEARGLKTGDMVKVSVGSREINVPVMQMPGQFAGSVTLAMGYGRTMEARICKGAGFNAYPLRASNAMGFASATVTPIGGRYALVTTQDHHSVDSVAQKAFGGVQDRLPTLFREGTLSEYAEHPKFASHRTHVVHRLSMFEEDHPFHSEDGRKDSLYAWGMSIDLNACTGCNACVIACQAENNIPIVGKDQVQRGREMHWIRVDRYFKGHNESYPDGFVLAPVTCMHCENAPCEQVCPVAATTHDDQGLNVMVYNRCIGTRYCSNNCPYKVRRFNYFDYHARDPHREQPGTLLQVDPGYYTKGQATADPLRQMQFNPEVTVRMRGIMEKCTYCVQRIAAARIDAKNDWVAANPDQRPPRVAPIVDGAVTPACAQACPAKAIVFGDLNDTASHVARLHKHERSYMMLEELNTDPRTRYMAKLRNPAFEPERTHGHESDHGHDADHDHASEGSGGHAHAVDTNRAIG